MIAKVIEGRSKTHNDTKVYFEDPNRWDSAETNEYHNMRIKMTDSRS